MAARSTAFQARQSEADRRQERAVSPGLAYEAAAEKAVRALGSHWETANGQDRGFGIPFRPRYWLYLLLRRWPGLRRARYQARPLLPSPKNGSQTESTIPS